MTYTIIARDPESGAIGGAAATANLAVGVFVLHLAPGIGGVATQGLSTNYYYGPRALEMLNEGLSAGDTARQLFDSDHGHDRRQLLVLDTGGECAAWTGSENHGKLGERCGRDVGVLGNYLADEAVLDAMLEAYEAHGARPLAARLLAALEAGESKGGDRRGTSSAAVRVLRPGMLPVDFRVDDDPDPVRRLTAVYELSQAPDYQDFLARLPTPDDPHRS